mgnify:FL=1
MPRIGTIRRIIVHHTASSAYDDPLAINRMHKRKFGGIGYHALVHRARGGDWVIGDGRDDESLGAHAGGANTGSLGVALAGNYEHADPDRAAVAMLVGQCLAWCLEHGLSADDIHPHRDVGTTATVCPGRIPIDHIRGAVRVALAFLRAR